MDGNGWPLALPDGATGISTLVLTGLPADAAGAAGRYVVTWQGQAKIALQGRAKLVSKRPFQAVFDYTPGEGTVTTLIPSVVPTDPTRNIVILRQDRADLLATGAIFNRDFLSHLKGARLMRFMDWQATNNSPLSDTADRPLPSDYTYASPLGVPMEIQIALANALQADPWFTIPHLATDEQMLKLAETARFGLDPALTAHVEFSNEVWNWQFYQAKWAEEQGRARCGQEGTWLQLYGLRAAEMARIWKSVYAQNAARFGAMLEFG